MNERKRFIRLPEVLNRTGLCKAWIYRLISRNEFPAQVKLGERAVAFLESDIDKWIEEKIHLSRNNID
ncbi:MULTISPECIES: helix-turn-helix transcriptional regulator [Enterobacterales]|uniref:helix-turn-helix transcriptional regulator n=1 Tax=Enterobacterales TaxID=91347 RepID=UPI00236172BE|nr:AlpA family transcriptional regulator [Serratia marcescens]EJW0364828.1 AlpA family transcriptional regulator [Salmonella enterica]